eukprot:scaffold5650_cov129-Isochrysis_galbana.AAC.3
MPSKNILIWKARGGMLNSGGYIGARGMLVGWTGRPMRWGHREERPDPHAPPWGHALETALTPERWSGRGTSEDLGVEG